MEKNSITASQRLVRKDLHCSIGPALDLTSGTIIEFKVARTQNVPRQGVGNEPESAGQCHGTPTAGLIVNV